MGAEHQLIDGKDNSDPPYQGELRTRVHLCWSAAVSGFWSRRGFPVERPGRRSGSSCRQRKSGAVGRPAWWPTQSGSNPAEGSRPRSAPTTSNQDEPPVCTSMSLMHRCTASYVRRRYRGWVRTVVERRKPLPGVPFRPRHPPCGTPTSLPSEHTSRRRCTGRSSCRRRAD